MIHEYIFPAPVFAEVSQALERASKESNPYGANRKKAVAIARLLFNELRNDRDEQSKRLVDMVSAANSLRDVNIPPIVLRGCFREDPHTFIPPADNRGFNYAESSSDRMKSGFIAEWCSWAIAVLFNCESLIHPSEHGGGNRFHMVSPLPSSDSTMAKVGASTGGGRFHLHNDATVFTDISNQRRLEDRLRMLGTDLKTVSTRLQKNPHLLVDEILCGLYVDVDLTMLTGIVNKDTPTYIGFPQKLGEHLRRIGYTQSMLHQLSRIPVAHVAGPADGHISGFIGNITGPFNLDTNENISSVCLNLAEGRMKYVGVVDDEIKLFDQFVLDARDMPFEKVVISHGDILMIPNTCFGAQTNVLHGRAELCKHDYKIEVLPGKYMRRVHCRQYLANNRRQLVSGPFHI